MDLRIMRDELRKTDDGYELLIYLSSDQTEFAKELGRDGGNEKVLENDVREYANKKYPGMKVKMARLMIGGLMVASIPLAATNMAAAAGPGDMGKTSDWAKASVQRLVDQKVITGDEKGNFNPQQNMDRDAFVTMLVRALGLQTATPDTPTFKDVSKDNWAFPYVETAYKAGLVKGDSATTFAPGNKITRQEMATIFVRALGLTPDDIKGQGDKLTFSDANAIADWAKDSVGFAVTQGLLKGEGNNRFAGSDVATREEVAVLADRFLQNKDALTTAAGELKAPTMTATMAPNVLDTVTLTFNKAVDNLTKDNITITGPNGEKINVNNVTLGADKKTATVTTDRMTAGIGYTVNVKTDALNRSDTVTPTSDTVSFAAVTAPNMKQVVVSFSGSVDKTTAEATGNYTFAGTGVSNFNPESATLQPDGKSVLLVIPNGSIPGNQTDRALTVANVRDAGGKTIDTATKTVSFLDTTVPTAGNATIAGPNTIKVTFSEPVQNAQPQDFLLDDGTYAVNIINTNPIDNSVTVQTGVDLTEGSHKLVINSTTGNTPTTQDYAGFKVPTTTLNFDYAKDTTAPAASSITAADPSGVTVKFSKPVDVNTVTAANFYHTYSGYTPDSVTPVTPVNGFADTFTLSFTSHLLPPGNVNVHVLKGAEGAEIKDAWGNIIGSDDATLTANVQTDVVKPVINTVASSSDKSVTLTFSKPLTQSEAENPANYVFTDQSGNVLTGNGFDTAGHPTKAPVYNDTDKTVAFTFDTAIPGGTYKVTASNITDTTMQHNTMDASTVSFNVNDTSAPTVGNVSLEGNNQVVVQFSEPMKTSGTGSILDLTNYQFNNKALPDGTTITPGANNKSAVITLPSGTTPKVDDTISVGHVADAAGNFTTSLGADKTIQAATGPSVLPNRAFSTGKRTIQVEVDTPLSAATTAGFTYSDGGVAGVSIKNAKVGPNNDIDGSIITVTLNKDIDPAAPGTLSISGATGTKDQFGTPIANASDIQVLDHLAPVVATNGVVLSGTDTITVSLNEALDPDTLAKTGLNGFSVTGGTITSATLDSQDPTKIIIKGSGFSTNTKVSYNGTQGVSDTNGNALGAITTATVKSAT